MPLVLFRCSRAALRSTVGALPRSQPPSSPNTPFTHRPLPLNDAADELCFIDETFFNPISLNLRFRGRAFTQAQRLTLKVKGIKRVNGDARRGRQALALHTSAAALYFCCRTYVCRNVSEVCSFCHALGGKIACAAQCLPDRLRAHCPRASQARACSPVITPSLFRPGYGG